jgi:hypothetical protein
MTEITDILLVNLGHLTNLVMKTTAEKLQTVASQLCEKSSLVKNQPNVGANISLTTTTVTLSVTDINMVKHGKINVPNTIAV